MGQILGIVWGGRGQIHFPLDCPSMTSSKGDRTLFAELGGLVTLVPHTRKGLPGMGPAVPGLWGLFLSPQAQDGDIGPVTAPPEGLSLSPSPVCWHLPGRQQGGRAGALGCSWQPLSSQMFSLC